MQAQTDLVPLIRRQGVTDQICFVRLRTFGEHYADIPNLGHAGYGYAKPGSIFVEMIHMTAGA
jgi:hypothetical protein